MESVYVIVENGESYPNVYTTYVSAVKAVNDKHRDELNNQILEIPDEKEDILRKVNPPEDISGQTYLYVEKGINITIYKLRIL